MFLTIQVALWPGQLGLYLLEDVKYFNITNNATKCLDNLPQDYASNYSSDKHICALFNIENTTVCTGFDGAGWAFQNPRDSRYYIYGILEIAPFNLGTQCAQTSAWGSRISYYYDFIERKY